MERAPIAVPRITFLLMPDLYSDDRWLSITWDAEHRCIYALWKVFATSRELRDGGEKILKQSGPDMRKHSLATTVGLRG